MTVRVLVWNEGRHEKQDPAVSRVYPQGIHGAIAAYLKEQGLSVSTATLDEPEHGLSAAALDATDVLVWWGHKAHEAVADAAVERVYRRVLEGGMGLVALHAAHDSKIFKRLMGTTCRLNWRDIGERERVWVVNPGHPIAARLGPSFDIPTEEMYGEFFDIPAPDELVFVSWFEGGEVFRSGCCYRRGLGKVFYFRPGHETYPTYHHPQVLRVIANAALWAAPSGGAPLSFEHRAQPMDVPDTL